MFPLQLNDGRRRFEHLGEVELNWEEGHYNCSNYKIVHWRPRHDSTSPAIFFLYSSLWGYLFWCSSITSSHTTMMARLCSAARVMISFSASFWLPYSYIVEMSTVWYITFPSSPQGISLPESRSCLDKGISISLWQRCLRLRLSTPWDWFFLPQIGFPFPSPLTPDIGWDWESRPLPCKVFTSAQPHTAMPHIKTSLQNVEFTQRVLVKKTFFYYFGSGHCCNRGKLFFGFARPKWTLLPALLWPL